MHLRTLADKIIDWEHRHRVVNHAARAEFHALAAARPPLSGGGRAATAVRSEAVLQREARRARARRAASARK
jgi:hypothetical protein